MSRLPALLVALAAALAGVLAVAAFPATGAAAQTQLVGIDVSNWQRQIDWLAVGGTGTSFVFAKATESTTFTDLTFAINRTGAAGVGLKFGAYHMGRPGGATDAAAVAGAIAQADYFLSVAQPTRNELLPVLDLEYTGNLTVARLSLWVQAWLAQVYARTGLRAIVYVSPSFWKERVGDSPVVATAGHRLWIAHWTKAALPILPGASWGGLGWSFWQWSNCQKITGITGCVDGNRLNGTTYTGLLVPAFPAGVPAKATAPTVVGSPQAGKQLAAVPGAWSGGKPVTFTYQWQRCDAVGGACATIAGAIGQSYVPVAADVGRTLRVQVRATASAGSASAVSGPTLAVAAGGASVGTAPVVKTKPVVSGTPIAGQKLTGTVGTWAGSPTSFAYQWRRCAADGSACGAIPGAGAAAYTLTPGDIGATVSLTVTATGKGGSGSATSALSAVVAAAPVPTPVAGAAVVEAGKAGAVVTPAGVATATWQPGALPAGVTVGLTDTASKLAVPSTSVRLTFDATAPLPWPVDVQYAAAAPDAVPGILPGAGVWQPLAQLPTPVLPAGQQAGAYRDAAGALHVVTRTSGRIALFAPGRWGDPRFTTALRPRLALASAMTWSIGADGSAVLLGRITLDTQAHLYAGLTAAGGRKLLLPQQGARIGWWLEGRPATTLQALQLVPGSLPIRLRIPAAQLRAGGPYTLRLVAVDPYGRKTTLRIPVGR